MRRYTADDILALDPCPGWRERIPGLVGDGLTARQIAERTDVATVWRRWVLTRLLYRVDPRELVLWACDCAMSTLDHLSGDARDAAECAIQAAVAWTEGAEDADGCRAAAADAAAYAAAYAAYAAAYAADAYAAYAYAYAADAYAYAASAADAAAAYAETTLSWLVLRLEGADA